MLAESLDELKEEGRLEGLEEGKLEGLQEGLQKGKLETAKNMLVEGMDIKMISHITGLSISEIEKL